MTLALRPLDRANAADFEEVARRAGAESAKCLCTAVYVPYWKDPALARPCRDRIVSEGRSDGYLLYDDGAMVGWCQTTLRDDMPYFGGRSRSLDPDPGVFGIACLLLVPERRGRGTSHAFLALVLDELRRRGVRRVHGFACRYGPGDDTSEAVEFPESLCVRAGMTLLEDHATRPIYGLSLA